MIPASIPEKEMQMAKLRDFFSALPDGEEVSWDRVAHDTEIKMDYPGRTMVRSALRGIRRPYEAIRGTGLRMSSAANAISILGGRLSRIDNAMARADRTRDALEIKHFAQMNEGDQRRMLLAKSFFGAVKAACQSNEGRKFLK